MSWPCPDCDADNPDGTRFCGQCGAPRGSANTANLQASLADVAQAISTTLADERTRQPGDAVNLHHDERLASARAGVEERRLVTAVFADVSGSTTLAHSLDAEQLVAIIAPIASRLAGIATRYGGYVGKFAGDAILAFFGAPVAHEDDAVRALLAAGDMQRESAELFAALGPEARGLSLHVGVNTGYVVAGFFGGEVRMEYSVLGDAVNVAQRLEAAAPGGAVYVGQTTYEMTRSRFAFEALGAIELKGKPEPVPCWRLAGEVAGWAGRGQAPPDLRLVGRDRELAELIRVIEPTSVGGGVAAIGGEPGMGKSALLQAARRAGEEHGARWVETHCVAYRSRPYRPYVELLRIITEIPEDVDPHSASARVSEELEECGVPQATPYFTRLLGLPPPAGSIGAAPDDPLAFRQGLHDSFAAYLGARARRTPLVLGIEDVHWADAGTMDLTRHLVGHTMVAPLSLVVTARPEGFGQATALAEGLDRSTAMFLGPLDRAAIHDMAAGVLDGRASPELAAFVADRTSGNPLFAQQLLRSLQDAGSVEEGPAGWQLRQGWRADAIPTVVEQVLAARVDMLPRPAADLLQVASVIGRDVLPALLRKVAGGGREHERMVELLIRGGFLDPVDDGGEMRLSFHHALLVDVAYQRLLRARQRDIHREVVAAVSSLFGTGDDVVDMLARHAQRGEMGAEALGFLERAGERSASLFANEQAVVYLRQAIDIAEGEASERLPGLLLRCAQVEETRGAYREALDLYQRSEALDGNLQGALGQAATLRKLGDYRACLEVLRQARESHPVLPPDDVARVALEEGWVLGLVGEGPRGAEVHREGLAALKGSANRALEAMLLIQLARNEALNDQTWEALPHAERARDILGELGDLPRLCVALRVLGGIQSELATDDAGKRVSRATLEQALELARRVGNAEEAAASLMNLGRTFDDLGLLDEALRCDREAADAFASVGLKSGVAAAYCNLAEHLGEAGRWLEARDAAVEGVSIAEEIGNAYWITGGKIGIADSQLALGDRRSAAVTAEAALDLAIASAIPGRARSALKISLKALRSLADSEGEARVIAMAIQAGVNVDGIEAQLTQ